MAREYNTFWGLDFIKGFWEAYAKHPLAKKVERDIFLEVIQNGETKEMHMFYLSFIISLLDDIVAKQNFSLVRYSEIQMVNFGRWFVIDALADSIYQHRKDSLGLKSFTCSTKEMNFQSATAKCVKPLDYNSINSKIEQIKTLTIIQMHQLQLEKIDTISIGSAVFQDTFQFYKILALVIRKCLELGLDKIDGIGNWAFYVAAYEIAHKIEADYNRAESEEGIA